MKMRSMCVLAAAALAAPAVKAAPDCSPTVEQLIQTSGIAALGTLFKAASPELERDLRELEVQGGRLSKLERSTGPRFREFSRSTVKVAGLTSGYRYDGVWVNGESSVLGAVQIHMAFEPTSACRLLAVHLDHQLRATEKSR